MTKQINETSAKLSIVRSQVLQLRNNLKLIGCQSQCDFDLLDEEARKKLAMTSGGENSYVYCHTCKDFSFYQDINE